MPGDGGRARRLVTASVLALGLGVSVAGGYLLGSARNGESGASPTVASLATRASATDHDSADVRFAQLMVPHHQQALAMAELASTRAGSSAVRTLAAQIEDAQQPEIDTMKGWLGDWGADPDQSSSVQGMSAMGDGMMSQADMDTLGALSGAAFDTSFLTMMIQHHSGAITMARTELEDGKAVGALALAASIQVGQQAEVDEMRALLG